LRFITNTVLMRKIAFLYFLCVSLAFSVEFLVVEDISVADGWQVVDIGCEYEDPVIVTGAITNNDTNSVVTQVRNVTTHSFEIRLIDWGTQALHTGTESITCMIAESGVQDYGGLTILAGKKNDFPETITMNNNGQTGYTSIYFTETPIFKQETSSDPFNYNAFGQVIGDQSPDPLHVRNHYGSAVNNWVDHYQFRFEKGIRNSTAVSVEEMHYIVVQCGSTDNSVPQRLESFTGARIYEEVLKPLTLPTLDSLPILMLDAPFVRGGDNTAIRYQDLEDGSVNIRTDEGPGYNEAHTTEEVSALVVGVNHNYIEPIDQSIMAYLAANYIPLSEQDSFLTTDLAASTFHPLDGGGLASGLNAFATLNAFALGDNAIAMGGAVALGNFSTATGTSYAERDYATAMGAALASGDYSTAMGESEAVADYSTSMGASLADGDYSTSMGESDASGEYSTAMGESEAAADYATAMGRSLAFGDYSTSMGSSDADGAYSTAMGSSLALGDNSIAIGGSYTEGEYSTAMGNSSTYADYSTALGRTSAHSYGTTTLGQYNLAIRDLLNPYPSTEWSGDREHSVLEVGIGTSPSDTKNALTIFQDGSCDIGCDATDGTAPLVVNSDGSVIISKPQGDISMGDFATTAE